MADQALLVVVEAYLPMLWLLRLPMRERRKRKVLALEMVVQAVATAIFSYLAKNVDRCIVDAIEKFHVLLVQQEEQAAVFNQKVLLSA